MKIFIFGLFMLLLLSACAKTGANVPGESQELSSAYQGPPPGSTLKCNCAASFEVTDLYFP